MSASGAEVSVIPVVQGEGMPKVDIEKNIYKILLFVSYHAGLCEQELIIPPQCPPPAYLP